jgi:hypothetical protein
LDHAGALPRFCGLGLNGGRFFLSPHHFQDKVKNLYDLEFARAISECFGKMKGSL